MLHVLFLNGYVWPKHWVEVAGVEASFFVLSVLMGFNSLVKMGIGNHWNRTQLGDFSGTSMREHRVMATTDTLKF